MNKKEQLNETDGSRCSYFQPIKIYILEYDSLKLYIRRNESQFSVSWYVL